MCVRSAAVAAGLELDSSPFGKIKKASSAVFLSHQTWPTHPEPSRSLVGSLLDLNPLECHVVDGSILDFLPPVLHRALQKRVREELEKSSKVEQFSCK